MIGRGSRIECSSFSIFRFLRDRESAEESLDDVSPGVATTPSRKNRGAKRDKEAENERKGEARSLFASAGNAARHAAHVSLIYRFPMLMFY